MDIQKHTFPTVFVIFGITGDLAKKKLIPSLFRLYSAGLLPALFQVVGFSRRPLTHEELRDYIRALLPRTSRIHQKLRDSFLSRFFYQRGYFDDTRSYEDLGKFLGAVDGSWSVCSNKLFYLAIPPRYYRAVLTNLNNSNLTLHCNPNEGWTRIILEKPFGENLESARALDTLLNTLFKEEQIYRVDHYLAKETVRNILSFRFSNSFLTPAWNKNHIEKVTIRLLEKETVQGRGEFYDHVGALRDVGQNHILQLLALCAMDNPGDFTPSAIRAQRSRVLKALIPLTDEEIKKRTIHGQYAGYTSEAGILPHSNTETYFHIKAFLNDPRWSGVPFYLESGKALDVSCAEITVVFRHHFPCLCPKNTHYQNVLRYQIAPKERILTMFLVKKPGYGNFLEEKSFEFDYSRHFKKHEFIDAYEKLLLDMIKGDQTLFVSTDEIECAWRFIDPIVAAWKKNTPPLLSYTKGARVLPLIIEEKEKTLKKQIGIIGLGKMGSGIASALMEKKWEVVGYNRSRTKTDELTSVGMRPAYSLKELVGQLASPRVIWMMLPAGAAVEEMLFSADGLTHFLEKGDIVVEAGNSFYKDSIQRARKLARRGVRFIDVGVSGGPHGARRGACLMVGGTRELYTYLLPFFMDIAAPAGVAHFEGVGAGHFIKMVHNGIEYGMMQSLAEGFALLKKSSYQLNLLKVARIYNTRSVITSRLTDWLESAFVAHGSDLSDISGKVNATGEAEWTVAEAHRAKTPIEVIERSLAFRRSSHVNPSFTGQVVSALRGQFGGHDVKK